MRSLNLNDRGSHITLDDERHATDTDNRRAIASITFSGRDESWGEFLNLDELALIHAWTGALLADIATKGP